MSSESLRGGRDGSYYGHAAAFWWAIGEAFWAREITRHRSDRWSPDPLALQCWVMDKMMLIRRAS